MVMGLCPTSSGAWACIGNHMGAGITVVTSSRVLGVWVRCLNVVPEFVPHTCMVVWWVSMGLFRVFANSHDLVTTHLFGPTLFFHFVSTQALLMHQVLL
jgi:hypothetical protein